MDRFILPHEHTSIDLSKEKNDDDCQLNVYYDAKEELLELKNQGCKAIFDCSNRGMGRNFLTNKKIQEELNLFVFCGTGYYKDPFMPIEIDSMSSHDLAEILIQELTHEIEYGFKASFIGEIGTSLNKMTHNETKLFEAAIMAHKQTQAPLLTHTTLGTLGIEQVHMFKKHQVHPEKIVISHVDLKKDYQSIVDILHEGVFVGFDTIGKNNYLSDEIRLEWIVKLIQSGYIHQLLLSLDITRKSHFTKNGGIGYGYFKKVFIQRLIEHGITMEQLDILCFQNPLRWLGVTL